MEIPVGKINSSIIHRYCIFIYTIIVSLVSTGCAGDEPIAEQSHTAEKSTSSLSKDQIEELENLGYVNWVPVGEEDAGNQGVTEYIPHLSYPGINLYNSRSRSTALLISMNGDTLHTWSSDVVGSAKKEVLERFKAETPQYYEGWSHIEMDANGDLFIIGSHHMLLKLDWFSNVLWKKDLFPHHDIALAENGDIYTLVDEIVTITNSGRKLQVLDNHIVILSPDGEVKRSISILDILIKQKELRDQFQKEVLERFPANAGDRSIIEQEKSFIKSFESKLKFVMNKLRKTPKQKQKKLFKMQRKLYRDIVDCNSEEDDVIKIAMLHLSPADILHSNTIEIIESDREGLWKKGNVLICVRDLNLIAVIDIETENVVWSWGTEDLEGPHHPSVLPGGDILVFDNGTERRYSRIVELDPLQKEIVWSYKGDPPASFFSISRGGCQKLPNGNVLITETNKGHVFEVMPTGQIVWNFFNPDFKIPESTDEELKRGGIYRMVRIDYGILKNIMETLPVK